MRHGQIFFSYAISGKGDTPLYEADLSTGGKREDTPHLDQFVINAALDLVDEQVWRTNGMYMRRVDSFNDFFVSTWVSAGHLRLMLLHKAPRVPDPNIRNFLQAVHELVVKTLMSPFYEPGTLFVSAKFDEKVNLASQRTLHSV